MVGVLKFENKPLRTRWYLLNPRYTTVCIFLLYQDSIKTSYAKLDAPVQIVILINKIKSSGFLISEWSPGEIFLIGCSWAVHCKNSCENNCKNR